MKRASRLSKTVGLLATLTLGLTPLALAQGQGQAEDPPRNLAEGEAPPRAFDFDDEDQYPELAPPRPDLPDASVAVYFELVGRSRMRHVEPNVPFEFFLVAHDPYLAVRGWELALSLDPRIVVIERELEGINVGRDDEFFVGIKPKHCLSGDTVVLARFRAMVQEEGARDLVIELGPVAKSSFDPPRPGYLVCTPDNELRPFRFEKVAAVLNPNRVQIEEDTPGPADLFKPVRGRSR